MVLFAIEGTPEVRAEVDKIVRECYPEKGLDPRPPGLVLMKVTRTSSCSTCGLKVAATTMASW